MLDEDDLGAYIDEHFARSLFRLERLPAYVVASDGGDYAAWLAGEPEPSPERKEPWLAVLRAERARGLYSRRVRIFGHPLTDYECYACEWGYALNGPAGEDIRVIDTAERSVPPAVSVPDFWLLDDELVVAMHYDESGRFEGAQPLGEDALPLYRTARDAAWAAGEAFDQWWSRHPEHRNRRPVARSH